MAHRAKDREQASIVHPDASPAQARGQQAEKLAGQYLCAQGLSILVRNVRCRGGEIDLVCLDHATLVFVEVRLRGNRRFGGAAASITLSKRQRLIHAARWWLAGPGRRYAAHACRFDVVLLDSLDVEALQWLRNAFDLDHA